MNHPVTLQTLVDDKLASLRSEGIHSQELHRSGILGARQAKRSTQSPETHANRNANTVPKGIAGLTRILLSFLR